MQRWAFVGLVRVVAATWHIFRCQSPYSLMTMQVMVITLYFFGRPSSGHPTICVRWPVNNCMMFVSLSGHQSSIVRWSVKTARCLSNFRPVFFVTLHRSKKNLSESLSVIYHRREYARSLFDACCCDRCVHDYLADEDRCWAIAYIADYHRSTTTVRVMWLRYYRGFGLISRLGLLWSCWMRTGDQTVPRDPVYF